MCKLAYTISEMLPYLTKMLLHLPEHKWKQFFIFITASVRGKAIWAISQRCYHLLFAQWSKRFLYNCSGFCPKG